MGNHRVASAGPRAGTADQYASEATTSRFTSPSALNLRNWPVSTRLIAVIVLALLMGLVFGGLRVASAADSAGEFGRVSQLAVLGQQGKFVQVLPTMAGSSGVIDKMPWNNAGTTGPPA